MTERELLTAGLRELGVAECPSAADNLLRYSEILREKNKVMNLTAITDPTEIVTRAFPRLRRHLHRICRRMDACSMWDGSRFSGHAAGDSVPADRVCAARCTGASALIF